MTWLSDLWFDVKFAWMSFRYDRQMHRDFEKDWAEELTRLREKGL